MKVSVVKCGSYDEMEVSRAVSRAIGLAGGIDARAGETVLLKVNLLSPQPPEKAVTTHPSVVGAVCRYLKDKKVKIQIGDSSGGFEIIGATGKAFEVCGMRAVAEKYGAKLVNFDADGVVPVKVDGQVLHKIIVAKPVLDADVVISMPKLKTHSFTKYTGAVKNCLGALPRAQKRLLHKEAPKEKQFCAALVDIYETIAPDFALMDGIVGMEGNGPSGGEPKHAGVILASKNCVALDIVASGLIGFDPLSIWTNQNALERGLCTKVEVVGDAVEPVPFKKPAGVGPERLMSLMPKSLSGLAYKMVEAVPVLKPGLCIGCGDCMRSCPAGAIKMENSKPLFDRKKCILCYCCQEICKQNAIDLKTILPMDFMRRLVK